VEVSNLPTSEAKGNLTVRKIKRIVCACGNFGAGRENEVSRKGAKSAN
jgi:hypothetical protein